MINYDFTPLSRSFIGFDRMESLIDNASKLSTNNNYPPYNITQISDDDYLIELAVAGFSDADIAIETHENVLSVVGTKAANDGAVGEYLHRGIAERGFERRFQMADHVVVTGAALENGLLKIALKRDLPEAMKPRKIEIGKGNETLINSKPCRKPKAA